MNPVIDYVRHNGIEAATRIFGQPSKVSGGRHYWTSPLRADRNPGFEIRADGKCFDGGTAMGDIIDVWAARNGKDNAWAMADLEMQLGLKKETPSAAGTVEGKKPITKTIDLSTLPTEKVFDKNAWALQNYGIGWDLFEKHGCSTTDCYFTSIKRAAACVVYPTYKPGGATERNKFRSVARLDKDGTKRACAHDKGGVGWFPAMPARGSAVIVSGGEEKALALIAAGYQAIAWTAGEGLSDGAIKDLAGMQYNVTLAMDGDAKGRECSASAAEKLRAAGCTVTVADLPDGMDVNDVLLSGGMDALRAIIDGATDAGEDEPKFILPEITKAELMARDYPEPEWLVDDFIPCGVTLLVAPPKAGKTFLCEVLADHIGAGLPWCGLSVTKRRVLYIDAEQNEAGIQQRYKAVDLENAESDVTFSVMPDIMFGETRERSIDLLTPQVVGRYDVIIFDTLANLFERPRGGGTDAYESARRQIRPVHRWAKANNLSVILIHHTNKASGRPSEEIDAMDAISGSNALLSVVDYGLVIRKHTDNEYKAFAKGRYVRGGVFSLKYDEPHWEFCGTFQDDSCSDTRRAILTAMREIGRDCTAREISDASGVKSNTVTQNLRRMAKGRDPIVKSAEGRGRWILADFGMDEYHDE